MTNILVIDDYPVTLRLLRHIVTHGGYNTFAATNTTEGLEVLEENSIAVLILDIDIPDMDGISFLQQLRQETNFHNLPVIMLTASGKDEDRIAAENAGADGFLTKPVSSSELLGAINQHIDP